MRHLLAHCCPTKNTQLLYIPLDSDACYQARRKIPPAPHAKRLSQSHKGRALSRCSRTVACRFLIISINVQPRSHRFARTNPILRAAHRHRRASTQIGKIGEVSPSQPRAIPRLVIFHRHIFQLRGSIPALSWYADSAYRQAGVSQNSADKVGGRGKPVSFILCGIFFRVHFLPLSRVYFRSRPASTLQTHRQGRPPYHPKIKTSITA